MTIYEFSPLKDPRWSNFAEMHPRASVFHSTMWLEALQKTYGYEPVAFTTSPPDTQLANGLVFCRIDSWLTGRRLVSLPFADHCEALVDQQEELQELLESLQQQLQVKNWRYIELRPHRSGRWETGSFQEAGKYYLHQLDLRPDLETLFRKFHKDSTQRKIRRAEREGLTVEEGRSSSLLDSFYHLQVLTRRRHRLPPQPRRWFQNLTDCFGETLKIRVASKHRQPVAAILTIRYKNVLVYKYGCSDSHFNNLGGTHLLFWRSIQEAKGCRLQFFDLGRSDIDESGLITFKDRWGAAGSILPYMRYPAGPLRPAAEGWKVQIAKAIFAHAPDTLLSAVGGLLYKHVG